MQDIDRIKIYMYDVWMKHLNFEWDEKKSKLDKKKHKASLRKADKDEEQTYWSHRS